MSKNLTALKWAVGVVVAASLAACGGGSDSTLKAASSNATTTFSSASNTSGVAGTLINTTPYTYSSGVPAFGTTSSTTLTVSGTAAAPTFSAVNGTNTASGKLSFGSCVFTVTASTYPATSPLALGKTVTVDPCSFTASTAGKTVSNVPAVVSTVLNLGGTSGTNSSPVVVQDDGTIIVNGVTLTKVTTSIVTGS